MKLICDSGSTKSAWCLTDGTTPLHFTTQGINPFQQNEEKIDEILHDELLPQLKDTNAKMGKTDCGCNSHGDIAPLIEEVHFYGAGCTAEKSPIVTKAIKSIIAPNATINVQSDMLGAAVALCGNSEGIVCILGTGSNSAYYDGTKLISCIPALGYILGDEGSGAYIGKRLVGDILKCQLSEQVRELFFDETKETQASIIQKTYREPMANRFLASLSPFCYRHRDIEEIEEFIKDCFRQFFERNIIPTKNILQLNDCTINCVGSIAHYYEKEIKEVAAEYHLRIGKILQAPIDGLVEQLCR